MVTRILCGGVELVVARRLAIPTRPTGASSGIMRRMTDPNINRIKTRYLVLAALHVSLCTAACGGATSQSHPLIGKPAPEITAEPVGGEGPQTLKAAQGKVVILDFWATYCVPCLRSFPSYQRIVDEIPDVAVIGVSVDTPDTVKKSQIIAFAKESHAKFSIVWDKDGSVQAKYRPPAFPSAFILDRSGTVRHLHVGYTDPAKITEEIKALVNAPANAAGGR